MPEMPVLYLCWFFSVMLFLCGIYCMMLSRNMLRIAIGAALMFKACALAVIACGFASGNLAAAQEMGVAVIMIGVLSCSVIVALALAVRRVTGAMDIRNLDKLKD
jgi:NADH:ubiquinone oxidoreductase subunit K